MYLVRSFHLKYKRKIHKEYQYSTCFELTTKRVTSLLVVPLARGLFGMNYSLLKHCLGLLGFDPLIKFCFSPPMFFILLEELLYKQDVVLDATLKLKRGLLWEEALNLHFIQAIRRKRGLPIRGQRTQTNAKTARRMRLLS